MIQLLTLKNNISRPMIGNRVVSTMLAITLMISVTGHADDVMQHSVEDNSFDRSKNISARFHDGPSLNYVDLVKAAGKTNNVEAQNEDFDSMVNEEISRAVQEIRSVCDSKKAWEQKISIVEKGLYDLLEAAEKYSQFESKLEIRTRILLSVILDVFYGSMVVKFDTPLIKWAKRDNIFKIFVSYYKFMYNMGDSVRPGDFKEDWARDMAQGLACLYE